MQKFGRFGETPVLREVDHESKMRLVKTHSHTSNGLAMEPGQSEEEHLKKTQTLYNKANHPIKFCRVLPVWRGGGRDGKCTMAEPSHGRGEAYSRKFLSSQHEELNQHHHPSSSIIITRKITSKPFVRATRPSFYAVVLKQI